jgi:hypothetical protein
LSLPARQSADCPTLAPHCAFRLGDWPSGTIIRALLAHHNRQRDLSNGKKRFYIVSLRPSNAARHPLFDASRAAFEKAGCGLVLDRYVATSKIGKEAKLEYLIPNAGWSSSSSYGRRSLSSHESAGISHDLALHLGHAALPYSTNPIDREQDTNAFLWENINCGKLWFTPAILTRDSAGQVTQQTIDALADQVEAFESRIDVYKAAARKVQVELNSDASKAHQRIEWQQVLLLLHSTDHPPPLA